MEEDIKILEEWKNWNKEHNISTKTTLAIENLLKAYKQDEKMIDLMADYIHLYTLSGEEDVYCFRVNNCEVVGGNKSCFDCIKEYFRKKVENE